MNLAEIQLRRAEEQLRRFDFHERPPKDKRGGVPLTDRICEIPACGNRLAVTNRSGVCARCADRHANRRPRKPPVRSDKFTYGGGI